MRRCATWPTPACRSGNAAICTWRWPIAWSTTAIGRGRPTISSRPPWRRWTSSLPRASSPNVPPMPSPRRAIVRAVAWRAGPRSIGTRALSRWAATRAAGACVKRESWRAWASRTTGSRSMPTRSMCSSAVNLGTEHDDPWTLALAFRFLGDIAINVWADVDRAEILLDRSLVEAERLGEPHAIARTLLFAGWVPWTRNRLPEAESIWRRALSIAERHDDRWGKFGRSAALDRDRRPRSARRSHGDDRARPRPRDRHGRPVQPRRRHRAGRPSARGPGGLRAVAPVLQPRGGDLHRAGGAVGARRCARRTRNRPAELGRLDEAERDIRGAIAISEELGERQLAGWTWRALAHVSERRGDHAQAAEHRARAEQEEARRPR